MPVARVTIHHEGAGTPSDIARGADGGYTYWVGPTRWVRLRSVKKSFATKGYNHVSVDVCISGDRTNIPVTDAEVRMIGGCVADARARGEVVDHPGVYPHSESFPTACPGNKTRERFPEIVAVCQVTAPTPALTWRLPLIFLTHPSRGTWIVMEGAGGKVSFLSPTGAIVPVGMDQDAGDKTSFGARQIKQLVPRTRNDGKPGFSIVATDNATYVPKSQI